MIQVFKNPSLILSWLSLCLLFNCRCQNTDTHRINYSDIRKKIQHCSSELNDILKLVNEISSTNEGGKLLNKN